MKAEYEADIRRAVEVLRKGGVILYPTDTVWGIGCDATSGDAVRRVFEIKKRADSKALITLVGNLAQLERTVDCIPEVAYQIIEFSERPTTIVYDHPAAGARLAPELLSADGTIGVRLTAEEFSSRLCTVFGRPLVSTSANVSGQPTARCFDEISDEIRNAVDYICESRRDEAPAKDTRPSVVMRLAEDGFFKILRD